MTFEENIKKEKFNLPKAAAPVGSYGATKIVGKLLYISGQISINENGELIKGKLGKELKTDDGYKAAERCALNITAQAKKSKKNENLKNVSIPKGIDIDSIDLEKAKFLCSLPKIIGTHPDTGKDITLNSGRFGPYLKCESKSARLENVEELFTIGLNRAIILIAEAKPGRISSSLIKDLGEHPEDKKPVRIMKGQYGPYIK